LSSATDKLIAHNMLLPVRCCAIAADVSGLPGADLGLLPLVDGGRLVLPEHTNYASVRAEC
jgi:hypothetical protein